MTRGEVSVRDGVEPATGPEGSPADPDTGALDKVNHDGTMAPLTAGLSQPTSVQISGSNAYVVTLAGQAWRGPLAVTDIPPAHCPGAHTARNERLLA